MSRFWLGIINAKRFTARSWAAIVTLVLCGAISLTAATVAHGGRVVADQHLSAGSGLRQIELESVAGNDDVKRLSSRNVEAVTNLSHVNAVEPLLQASFASGEDVSPPFLLYATTTRASVLPPLEQRIRPQLFPLRADEAVLPSRADGVDLRGLLGHTITIEYTKRIGPNTGTGAKAQITVVGLFDPTWQIDGPNAAYLPVANVVAWAAAREGITSSQFLRSIGYSKATVVVDDEANVAFVVKHLQQDGFFAYAVRDRVRELPGVLSLFRWGANLMLGLLVLLSVIVGFGMGGTVMRQRVREVGLLRALGNTRRDVSLGFTTEFGVIGLAAGVLAFLVGSAAGMFATRAFAGVESLQHQLPKVLVMPPLWVVVSTILIPPLAVLTGSLLPIRRATNLLDPAEALRDW